jgi:hypothetical protein
MLGSPTREIKIYDPPAGTMSPRTEVSVTRIYVGERPVPEPVLTGLAAGGFTVVPAEAPAAPGEDDYSLVPARDGATSTLRHALTNQLTAILGYSELTLRDPGLPPSVREKLSTVKECAQKCRRLLRRPENVE